MTKPLTALAVCAALAGGTLAACGDDDEDSASTTPTSAPTTSAKTTAAAGAVEIDMKDIKYVPQNATAKVGQTVKWTNSDPVAHTVTAKSGSDIDSGTIDPGKEFEAKFDKAGKVDYVCTIHPNQTGTVTVR